MKLLLTSNGLSNDSIVRALIDLVGKKPEDTKIVFIPTAANLEVGDMGWFVDNLIDIQKCGFEEIQITDISAVDEKIWRPKFENADILFFQGGNSYHLMSWINKSGLVNILPELMKTKVWVGASAGAMVTNPTLALTSKDKEMYYEEVFGKTGEEALGFVDFYIRPHFNSPSFPEVRKEYLEDAIKGINEKVYVLDDNSAVKVDGDKVEVVSEGEWIVFN